MVNFIKCIVDFFESMFRHKSGHGISILVPFRCPEKDHRSIIWKWIRRYWKHFLPGAEIVIGVDPASEDDPLIPFSKSAAVNDAASRAHGDIFCIVDADGLINILSVIRCARNIRKARREGRRLWYIPYRHFYRLNRKGSKLLLDSSPCDPYQFSVPPNPAFVQNTSGSQHGHWFGAMIQVMSREAFFEVGGWDPRFRGWGGEDSSAMRAMDTLYSPHKTMPFQVLHIWHPMLSVNGASPWVEWNERVWANQTTHGDNSKLSGEYYAANGDYGRMRKLLDEGFNSEL